MRGHAAACLCTHLVLAVAVCALATGAGLLLPAAGLPLGGVPLGGVLRLVRRSDSSSSGKLPAGCKSVSDGGSSCRVTVSHMAKPGSPGGPAGTRPPPLMPAQNT